MYVQYIHTCIPSIGVLVGSAVMVDIRSDSTKDESICTVLLSYCIYYL